LRAIVLNLSNCFWYLVSITESAKTTADNLKNPLGGFDKYSKLLNELIKKKSSTSSKHHDVLKKLEEDFQRAQALESGPLKTNLTPSMRPSCSPRLKPAMPFNISALTSISIPLLLNLFSK
jgi:ABC-type transporter Mla subunit MlaD